MNGAPFAPSTLNKGGFTIVETLIVLAVSGALFFSAILLFAGQQRKVEFNQAGQDVLSVVNQTMSEIGSGYYPNAGNVRCVATGTNITVTPNNNGTEQGSNTGCIFLGKAIQFGVRQTDPQNYIVHTIAGLQDNDDGSLATARPKAVNVEGTPAVGQLRGGLRAVSMRYVLDGSRTDIGAVAFVNGLGSYSDNMLMSGTQQLALVPVTNSGSVPNTTSDGVVSAIDSRLRQADELINPNGGVEVCFAGSAGQWALLTIGSQGRTLSAKLDIKSASCI